VAMRKPAPAKRPVNTPIQNAVGIVRHTIQVQAPTRLASRTARRPSSRHRYERSGVMGDGCWGPIGRRTIRCRWCLLRRLVDFTSIPSSGPCLFSVDALLHPHDDGRKSAHGQATLVCPHHAPSLPLGKERTRRLSRVFEARRKAFPAGGGRRPNPGWGRQRAVTRL
jgi:hypothetical protein